MPKLVWPNDKRNSLGASQCNGFEGIYISTQRQPLLPGGGGRFPMLDIAPFSQALTGANVFTDSGESSAPDGGARHHRQVVEFHKILHVLAQTFLGIDSIWRI